MDKRMAEFEERLATVNFDGGNKSATKTLTQSIQEDLKFEELENKL